MSLLMLFKINRLPMPLSFIAHKLKWQKKSCFVTRRHGISFLCYWLLRKRRHYLCPMLLLSVRNGKNCSTKGVANRRNPVAKIRWGIILVILSIRFRVVGDNMGAWNGVNKRTVFFAGTRWTLPIYIRKGLSSKSKSFKDLSSMETERARAGDSQVTHGWP